MIIDRIQIFGVNYPFNLKNCFSLHYNYVRILHKFKIILSIAHLLMFIYSFKSLSIMMYVTVAVIIENTR